jgi:hypothetical protein
MNIGRSDRRLTAGVKQEQTLNEEEQSNDLNTITFSNILYHRDDKDNKRINQVFIVLDSGYPELKLIFSMILKATSMALYPSSIFTGGSVSVWIAL